MPKDDPANDAERMERAEEYMAAAREHYDALAALPDEPSRYPIAYYLAGLAVECLFRAYVELVGGQHDPNHDLRRLAESGRFLDFMPPDAEESLAAEIGNVRARWLNNHRYRSLAALKRFLNESRLYRLTGNRSIRGNSDRVVRHNWEILREGAQRLLTIGIKRWELSKAKWNRSSKTT
jgi:HEPN domain-containing protein